MVDCTGENGRAEIYKCGVLAMMAPPKARTNLMPSLAIADTCLKVSSF